MRNTILGMWMLLILTTGSAYAIIWNPGKLVLRNGTELEGELIFNWKAEIVQYRQDNRIKAYSIDQVSNFVYFDNEQNNLRKFVAIDHCSLLQNERPQFLEEISSGIVMVYRSLQINHTSAANFNSRGELMKTGNAFSYIVFTGDEWLTLHEFYDSRWPQLMLAHQDDLKPYTKITGIGSTTLLGRMILICKYNALMAQAIFHEPSADQSILTTDRVYEN